MTNQPEELPRLGRVILFVADPARMTAFYVDTLGLRECGGPDSTPSFVVLEAGGVELCLHELPAEYKDGLGAQQGDRRSSAALKPVLMVSDIEEVRSRLLANNAPTGTIMSHGTLRYCDSVDPEGNVFQIASREG